MLAHKNTQFYSFFVKPLYFYLNNSGLVKKNLFSLLTAPSIEITNFHVTILNNTAVEVTWQPPSSTIGLNGQLRGFKLYVDKINGNQTVIDIVGALQRVYFVTGLEELATYLFSIVMYTVGDGPHSVRLQVTMPNTSESDLQVI